MQRKWILSALAGTSVAVALIAWQTTGQGPAKGRKDAALPIRQVVLFNSGVSYLQREGEVDGNAQIDLSFPTSDINDLLKSMVLSDLSGNGKITSVNYDSHDPIDKILRSFAVDLNNNPTYSQILNQARGEKIEILRQPASSEKSGEKPVRLTGTIVGMELHKKIAAKETVVDVEHLNIVGDNGLQSIPLEQVASVRFLNPVLEAELQRALRVVASSHDTQKKTVSLGFTGVGKRKVRVGYVIEHPIWKTSYRLRMEPNGNVFIQGWAIVENTSDDDWNDVHMTLVSGRPISFKMDLYEPLYIPRPTVEPELFASLRPPVYGGPIGGRQKVQEMAQMKQAEAKDGQPKAGDQEAPEPGYDRDITKARKKLNKIQDALEEQGKAEKKIAGLNFREGVSSVANASELGEYYQYTVKDRITLPRQKSAMLPIIDQTIAGAKVSIYNEATHVKYPLLGLRLKNSSGQPLNQGPITVYEENDYVGDTRILDLNAGEERLLSYALDQSVEIKTEVKSTVSPDMHLVIGEANLTANYSMRETRTYTIKNRAAKERTVLLEHPLRGDWKLVEPTKPLETTRDLYRFQVKVPAGATATFDVVEDHARSDQFAVPGGQPTYLAGTGVAVKALTSVSEEKLLALKVHKGFAVPTLKSRESKTYFVQNNSDIARTLTVDHIIRAGWVRLGGEEGDQKGPAVFRFVLPVPKSKTASREVIEERTYQQKGELVKNLAEEKIRTYLASPVPSAEVKAALTKVLTLTDKVADTSRDLGEKEKQLRQLTDDQARLGGNLKIIPQSAEPYKKFLDKFVQLESEIETLQKQVRQLQATLLQQQRELDVFVAGLTVE